MIINECLQTAIEMLSENSIENAEYDAFELLEKNTGIGRTSYLVNEHLLVDEDVCRMFFDDIKRRCKHEPLQHILGYAWFYGRKYEVSRDVLVPRFDTEVLVERALKCIDKEAKVLDMCTGSGCIGITIALEKDAKVTAVDISESALEIAGRNASMLGAEVHFVKSDLFEMLDDSETFDMIISNPPYIPSEEIPKLSVEVKDYDPILALDGDLDGLKMYRLIISQASKFLKKDGTLIFEIGYDQAEAVSALMREAGFVDVNTFKDLAGLDRIVGGRNGNI